jgi:N-methylhydantoinase A/oxoprolinase/acetone carboxylase beta subunit
VSYLVGLDIGGTFTDCAIVDRAGKLLLRRAGHPQGGASSVEKLGYAHGLQIAPCGGGTVPVERAGEAPLLTLDSGPVSGVTASLFLGAAMGEKNPQGAPGASPCLHFNRRSFRGAETRERLAPIKI